MKIFITAAVITSNPRKYYIIVIRHKRICWEGHRFIEEICTKILAGRHKEKIYF
jgi:hypothetical protein